MPKRPASHDLMSTPLSVSFRVGERAMVQQAAALSGKAVAAFIREAAVKAAERTTKAAPQPRAA